MISPIELTPEQREKIYMQKAQKFMDGVAKLTEETGLVLRPGIQHTEHGAMIIMELIDAPPQQPDPITPPNQ